MSSPADKPFAFVVMSFDPALDPVFEIIKKAADEAGVYAERVDGQVFDRPIIVTSRSIRVTTPVALRNSSPHSATDCRCSRSPPAPPLDPAVAVAFKAVAERDDGRGGVLGDVGLDELVSVVLGSDVAVAGHQRGSPSCARMGSPPWG